MRNAKQGNDLKLNVVNIYAPNGVSDCKAFFELLHHYFLSQGDYIVVGDFNCVDRAIDKFHSDQFHSSDKTSLAALKADFRLVDVYRKLNPHGISFTWSNSSNSQASRLDRFFISQPVLNGVCSNQVLPCPFSDHDFVCLEFAFGDTSNRHCGTWKFNTNLLSDPDFWSQISNLISSQKSKIASFASLGDWCDNLKILIPKSCISFSASKRRALNLSRNTLTNQLIRAKRAFDASALSSLVLQEAEGAKVCSRVQWIEESEKPTRFFFRLETKRAAKNSFNSLFDASGVEKTSQVNFNYELLYTGLFCRNIQ